MSKFIAAGLANTAILVDALFAIHMCHRLLLLRSADLIDLTGHPLATVVEA